MKKMLVVIMMMVLGLTGCNEVERELVVETKEEVVVEETVSYVEEQTEAIEEYYDVKVDYLAAEEWLNKNMINTIEVLNSLYEEDVIDELTKDRGIELCNSVDVWSFNMKGFRIAFLDIVLDDSHTTEEAKELTAEQAYEYMYGEVGLEFM